MSNTEKNIRQPLFSSSPEEEAFRAAYEAYLDERESFLKTEEGIAEQKTWMTLLYRTYGPKIVEGE